MSKRRGLTTIDIPPDLLIILNYWFCADMGIKIPEQLQVEYAKIRKKRLEQGAKDE